MKELYTALLSAKKKISPPSKNKKAMYGKYADLEAVLQAVERPLADEGLVIVQSGTSHEGQPYLQTRLVHVETGQELTSEIPLVSKDQNDPQKLGGSITYARRYGITALLSIVADDDDDGNTSSNKNRDGTKKQAGGTGKGVTQDKIEEVFSGPKDALPEKLVEALLKEYKQAGFEDSKVIPEIRSLLNREFKQVNELTEAEARTAVGHARKIKSGEQEPLNE